MINSTIKYTKLSSTRTEGVKINTVVLTNSVKTTINSTVVTLLHRGASVHYTIEEDGTIVRHHLETDRVFTSGSSSWHGKGPVDDFAVTIMLINDGKSQYTNAQIDRLIELIKDINDRYGDDVTIVMLSEINKLHVALGKLFPWHLLEEAGIVKKITVPDYISSECTLRPDDENEQVSNLQNNLKTHGYGIEVTGVYDSSTEHFVNVFRERYTQNESDINCWSDKAGYVLNELGLDNSQPSCEQPL